MSRNGKRRRHNLFVTATTWKVKNNYNIKVSDAASELRDFVLKHEDTDPLLKRPRHNPFMCEYKNVKLNQTNVSNFMKNIFFEKPVSSLILIAKK